MGVRLTAAKKTALTRVTDAVKVFLSDSCFYSPHMKANKGTMGPAPQDIYTACCIFNTSHSDPGTPRPLPLQADPEMDLHQQLPSWVVLSGELL